MLDELPHATDGKLKRPEPFLLCEVNNEAIR